MILIAFVAELSVMEGDLKVLENNLETAHKVWFDLDVHKLTVALAQLQDDLERVKTSIKSKETKIEEINKQLHEVEPKLKRLEGKIDEIEALRRKIGVRAQTRTDKIRSTALATGRIWRASRS